MPTPAPLLLSLPHGLDLGGVTSWAVRLANGLAGSGPGGGRPVSIIAHPCELAAGQPPAKFDLHPGIRLLQPAFPPMAHIAGDLSPFIPIYRDEALRLANQTGRPVVISPNILGDSYGLAAALCTLHADTCRVLGWQHTDSDYDLALLNRYEPITSRFVAIDDRHTALLSERFPHRRADISAIPHGVEVPAGEPPRREPLSGRAGRPLRLVYTGRLEHRQKRITALAYLADQLRAHGINHELVIIGDGPAAADFAALAATRPSIQSRGLLGPAEVQKHLRRADAFILPSRYEGLCISRIEAMAVGCIPIITHDHSGAASHLQDGISAELVPARSSDDEPAAARALADAVARFATRSDDARRAMALAAWRAAREHFSINTHVRRVSEALDAAADSPPRWWRASWPCAFSNSPAHTIQSGSGSTPANAAHAMRAILDSLAGRKVILHGAGLHTLELAHVLAQSRATIVALTDDDRAKWNTTFLGWTVLPPAEAASTGATDIIISSFIHADSIHARRAVYEQQGFHVHRLYLPPEGGGRVEGSLSAP